jgi:hypothetical protein
MTSSLFFTTRWQIRKARCNLPRLHQFCTDRRSSQIVLTRPRQPRLEEPSLGSENSLRAHGLQELHSLSSTSTGHPDILVNWLTLCCLLRLALGTPMTSCWSARGGFRKLSVRFVLTGSNAGWFRSDHAALCSLLLPTR